MQLYNSMGKQMANFNSRTKGEVKIWTCGPSVYQRAHIGNYRTFLYEDTLVRYLVYKGYKVERAMNFTDIEDKAVEYAIKNNRDVFAQTEPAKQQFFKDLELLGIQKPTMAMASTSVDEAISIISKLIDKGFAYNDKGNVYFIAEKDSGFGKLFGREKLMARWPKKRRKFSLDTYPGMRWNLGDFILWHKANNEGEVAKAVWDSPWGKGRPSWNVQDPAMIMQTLGEQVDINCGGIDNIIRHHDYNIAIMEQAFDKTYANYYMHGAHLYVDGKKMSKSLGNIYYPNDLIDKGYSGAELRFFLTASKHYRQKLNYTNKNFEDSVARYRLLKGIVDKSLSSVGLQANNLPAKLEKVFNEAMDNDLSLKVAVDGLIKVLHNAGEAVYPAEKELVIKTLKNIDEVLQFKLV